MAKYYQDFVGLNTFVYSAGGWFTPMQSGSQNIISELVPSENPTVTLVGGIRIPYYVKQNYLGWFVDTAGLTSNAATYKNFLFPVSASYPGADYRQTKIRATASFFHSLLTQRNGPYGYPSWKQVRTGQNPLTRKQNKHNIFTYVEEPGRSFKIDINGNIFDRIDKYGPIRAFQQPIVTDCHKPLELVGGVSYMNPNTAMEDMKNVMVKTSFGNEMIFFTNQEINDHYDSIEETDGNYEQLKELYLNDGLDDDASPVDQFVLLTYKQTVWPKAEYSYLNKTRSRLNFENKFWRSQRVDRKQSYISNGFGSDVPSQSMWPLDPPADFATRPVPTLFTKNNTAAYPTVNSNYDFYPYYIGGTLGAIAKEVGHPFSATMPAIWGFNTGRDILASPDGGKTVLTGTLSQGGAGILMNSYAQLARGAYADTHKIPNFGVPTAGAKKYYSGYTSASCYYSRLNTLNYQSAQVAQAGMNIQEISSSYIEGQPRLIIDNHAYVTNRINNTIPTGAMFCGHAAWDAPRQANKEPFYDSYDSFAQNIRLKGKGYSIIPEFRISSHVAEYETLGITQELKSIFELSGANLGDTDKSSFITTSGSNQFYKILSNSDFMKHFELIKEDHSGFTQPSVITLRCKAVKKFLPYEGFYPAQRTVQIAQQFYSSYSSSINISTLGHDTSAGTASNPSWTAQPLMTPLFAPGVLFNAIKSGVAVDYPILTSGSGMSTGSFYYNEDHGSYVPGEGYRDNYLITGSFIWPSAVDSPWWDTSENWQMVSMYAKRIPFEALVEPESHLKNEGLMSNEPHPYGNFSGSNATVVWDGKGDKLYTKIANNFLAEVPEFFLKDQNFTSFSSLESSNPEFGNAVRDRWYAMRIKMYHTTTKPNDTLPGVGQYKVSPPQDLETRLGVRENFTMYSRPTAFGPPTWGGGSGSWSTQNEDGNSTEYYLSGSDSLNGFNFPYTPPYYHGEGWCDLIFSASETRKYSLDEILSQVKEFPYYSRFWWPGENDAVRDLAYGSLQSGSATGGLFSPRIRSVYTGSYSEYYKSPWRTLINRQVPSSTTTYQNRRNWFDDPDNMFDNYYVPRNPGIVGPQHPSMLNYNAMQLNSSVNLFGKGIKATKNLETDGSDSRIEVYNEATNASRARWVMQTKFETPMLNFNKYDNLHENNCTMPVLGSSSVPRGMWHQYGTSPTGSEGVYLSVGDLPKDWLGGALGIPQGQMKKVHSLADLVGFSKNPKRLGQAAEVKEISEAVVAVPFIEVDQKRKFFSIPREEIDDVTSALRREVEPGVFVAGGPPKSGESIINLVKMMQRYVFPPSMDYVRYNQISPFAMYIFEFKHNLTKQDLTDIWQNLPPEIGTSFEESESTISHQLLADELLGGGAVIKNNKLNPNAQGPGIPDKLQWMIFKVKRRAATKYFDKVVSKTGRAHKAALALAYERQDEKTRRLQGEDPDITYNWPYDFFSLVELVKLNAEVTFSEFEKEDESGSTVFKPKRRLPRAERTKRKAIVKKKMKALGKSGASKQPEEEDSLLDKVGDFIDGVKERRNARKKNRKDKRKKRKENRAENKKDRKNKRNKRKEKRKNKKKNKRK